MHFLWGMDMFVGLEIWCTSYGVSSGLRYALHLRPSVQPTSPGPYSGGTPPEGGWAQSLTLTLLRRQTSGPRVSPGRAGPVPDPDPTRAGDPRREGGPLPVPDPDSTRVGDPRTEGGPREGGPGP